MVVSACFAETLEGTLHKFRERTPKREHRRPILWRSTDTKWPSVSFGDEWALYLTKRCLISRTC